MPLKNRAGTFELHCHRWTKMIAGVRHRITCRKLGLPRDLWTKAGSQAAANAWFAKIEHPHANVLQDGVELIQRQADFYRFTKNPELSYNLEQFVDEIKKLIGTEPDSEIAKMIGIVLSSGDDWGSKLAIMEAAKPSKKEQLIDTKLKEFLAEEMIRVAPTSFREINQYLLSLQTTPIFPKSIAISEITEITVTMHFAWLSSMEWAPDGKNKRLGFFRKFINWLFTEGHLALLPKNIKAKRHRFKTEKKAIREFSGVANVVKSLPSSGQHNFRLWALLALNCSVTQADFGRLSWRSEESQVGVDLVAGTLTRFRGKTEQHPKAPIVVYKLWPETMKELAKIKKRFGLLFTVESGKPLYETFYKNGKPAKKDMVTTYWNRISPKPPISFGKFRSIGATQLKKDHLMRQYREVWLADVPTSVPDTNYSAEYWKTFGEACMFIRTCIFGTKPVRWPKN